MKIIGKELTFNGNKVYHVGSKPTVSEIGAAASSHTHNYAGSSSAGGAATSALTCTGNSATATKATQDSAGQQINTTYIKGLSVSGRTITYTKGNGTTGTITTQDTNTTYSTGTASTSGLTKLYTGTGTATDGTMTQAAINTALSGKAASSHTHNYAGSSSAGGAANSANTLATARTINGTSFNGSANITTANWGTARTLTVGNTGKSVNGSGNISWNLNEIGATPGSTVSGTTAATAQWYRIAQTTSTDQANTIGKFTIRAAVSGKHSSTIITAGVTYGMNPTLNQLAHTQYSVAGITKARIVYHTTYSGNRAYLEVYVPDAAARTIDVQLEGSLGWSLIAPSTVGSIPTGYTSTEITFAVNRVISNVTGALSGNASTATTLQTARTINGTSFNGSANITTANWGTARSIGIVNSDGTGTAVTTSVNGSGNVNLKLPSTIKATLTGNASTATTLQTARTINGTSFNGSANITTANWGTARTLTIGNTGKSVNGSGNVSWSLSEIGAAPASHTHSYLPLSGGNITGSINVSADVNVGNTIVCKDVVIKSNQVIYSQGTGSIPYYALIGLQDDGSKQNLTIGYNNQAPLHINNHAYFKYEIDSNQCATFRQGSLNNRAICVETWTDSNQQGDGNSYFALNDGGKYYHYLRGKGQVYIQTTGGMHVSHGIKSLSAIDAYSDINTRTGITYSSSMNEKTNITPLRSQVSTMNINEENTVNYDDIITKGIKDTKLHLYNYKKTKLVDENTIELCEKENAKLEDQDIFIGFLGQELEKENPDFFNLIGSSYEQKDGNIQYKIRESSVIGVLWAGLQSAFKEIECLKSKIEQ